MLISSLFFFKTINACVSQPCSNQCCQENPCFNGGTCTELCAHANRKFNCTCAIGSFGKFCEKKTGPTSCKELQIEAKKPKHSAVYTMYDPTSKSFYQTFCDFTSENGFVWTLLESFRLGNKIEFQNQQFYKDHRVNQNSFTWNKFCLSRFIMNSTSSHSTHVRATCNFNIDGMAARDYLRAKTSDLNILLLNGERCFKVPVTLILFYFRRKVEAFTNHNILKWLDFLQSFMFFWDVKCTIYALLRCLCVFDRAN